MAYRALVSQASRLLEETVSNVYNDRDARRTADRGAAPAGEFRRDLAESYKFAAEMRKLTTEGYKLDCEQSLAPVVAVGVLAGVVSGLIATLLTLAVRLH